MRYQRIITRGILATSLMALALTVVPAQQGPRRAEGGRRGPNPELMLEMMASKLQLSPNQETAVREIFEAHRAEMQGLHEQLRAARQDVKQEVEAEQFDEAAIRQAAIAAGQVEADVAVARASHQQSLRAELTPEQWDEWKAFQEQFAGRMARRGPRPGGSGSGQRGSR